MKKSFICLSIFLCSSSFLINTPATAQQTNSSYKILLADDDGGLTETYRGSCNGEVKDSNGNYISCPGERPVCYSDGSCTCEPDPQCE